MATTSNIKTTLLEPTSDLDQTPPSTPTEMTTAAHNLLDEIRDIYSSLQQAPSLAPSPHVNALLTRLVTLCIRPHSTDFTSYIFSLKSVANLCLNLRPLCATAEGELEKHWARRILSSATQEPSSTVEFRKLLSAFPYWQNYIDLSRLECSVLEAFLPASPTKFAFIGSGPLPLTSFCILDRYAAASVHNVDRDAGALEVSGELVERFGYKERMTFSCEDVGFRDDCAERKVDWKAFQVVFLAALVGMDTQSKMGILKGLAGKLAPGTVVVVRSAKGMRQMLYPVLDLSKSVVEIGYEVLAEVHPWTQVVNSVIALRVNQ